MHGLLALAALCGAAAAQELEISVSPSPVGSGARAAGMADAFVAVADDATAASWNPAGLVQLERPEIAIVGEFNGIWERFSAYEHEEVDSWHNDQNLDLNFLSFTYPLPFTVLDRNVVAGLYYQHKYDFTRSFDLEYNISSSNNGTVLSSFLDMDFEQKGSLSTITPAVAFELTHRFSLGLAVNLWRSTLLSENGWEQDTRTRVFTYSGSGSIWSMSDTHEQYDDVHGTNMTIGALWNVNDRLSLGARYDTAWTAHANYRRMTSNYRFGLGGQSGTPLQVIPRIVEEPRSIRFPATLALGAAYRFNDRFTLACDVSRTDWNDFWYKGRNGWRMSLVNNENFDWVFFEPHFEPTYTVRLGGEYVFIPKQPDEELKRIWTARGGVFYDQEPASSEPDNFWGIACGVGLLTHQRVNIDLAYQLRYGHNVNADFIRGIEGYNEDVFQHRFLISTVIYF